MSQSPTTSATPSPGNRYWIRNEVGRVWGPYTLESLGRVNVGKEAATRALVSTDGQTFVPVTQFPDVQAALERAAKPPPIKTPAPFDIPTIPPRASAGSAPPPPPPPPAEPVVVGMPAAGDLQSLSVARLYAQAAGTNLTGKLSVIASEGNFGVFFKKGTPERVEYPQPAGTLAKFLIQRGVAPAADIQNAVEISGGPDGELVDALFALGVVPQHLLFPLLGEHGVDMLWRVLNLEVGTFTWEEGTPPPPGSFSLGQKWDLLCRWVRKVPRMTVRERLGQKASRAAYRSSGAFVTLEALKLTAQEARIAASFDGTHSAEQRAFEHVAEPDVVYRTALLLGEVGYLAFGPVLSRPAESAEIDQPILERVSAVDGHGAGADGDAATVGKVGLRPTAVRAEVVEPSGPKSIVPPPPKAVTPPPPVAAKPAPKPAAPPPAKPTALPPAKPAPPAAAKAPVAAKAEPARAPAKPARKPDPSEDVAALIALLEKWKKANHFDVLGLPQTAGPADIKAAYIALARQYHPDTVTDPAQSAVKQAKADLIARVNEAYQLLSDTQSRTKYVAELAEGGKVDIGPILQAEEDFLRATILVKARKFVEAEELLSRAIEMNPNELEFLAWRAWARFSSTKDKKDLYDESMAICARVVKEMPQCAAAHLFLGQMAKIMGDPAKAEKAFRAVLEIDPNHIDAKRELRGKM